MAAMWLVVNELLSMISYWLTYGTNLKAITRGYWLRTFPGPLYLPLYYPALIRDIPWKDNRWRSKGEV
jgi:hypothetical protein